MLLHNIYSAAFTFNSQRSWGRTEAGFRHNCQSTYPPTYCWLQSLTVPGKHTHFPAFMCCVFLLVVFKCICSQRKITSTYQQQRPAYTVGHRVQPVTREVQRVEIKSLQNAVQACVETIMINLDTSGCHMHECTQHNMTISVLKLIFRFTGHSLVK